MSDAAERERFEVWFRLKYLCAPDIESNLEALGRWQAWQARAALAPKPGYVLVPVEPTPEMVAAYLAENDAYWIERDELVPPPGKWRTGTPAEATARSYSAMIAAAPSAPATPNAQPEPEMTDCPHGVPHRWSCGECDAPSAKEPQT